MRTGAVLSSFSSHILSVTRGLNDLVIALVVSASSSACCRMVANGGSDAWMNNLHYYAWNCLRLLSVGIMLGVESIFLIHFRTIFTVFYWRQKNILQKKKKFIVEMHLHMQQKLQALVENRIPWHHWWEESCKRLPGCTRWSTPGQRRVRFPPSPSSPNLSSAGLSTISSDWQN